jgi:hypothetical protein
MTDIEAKALALVNGVRTERGGEICNHYTRLNRSLDVMHEALCRAIEAHEAFKQEVSDALVEYFGEHLVAEDGGDALASFVIPKPKPDPLVRVINEVIYAQPQGDISEVRMAKEIRAALEARGLEIREKGQ